MGVLLPMVVIHKLNAVRIRLQGNDTADVRRLRAGFNVECKVKY